MEGPVVPFNSHGTGTSANLPNSGFETVSGAIGTADNYTKWVIEACFDHIPLGDLVEVGVGHANYRALLNGLSSYVGVDIDKDVLEKAKLQWPQDRFVEADMCSASFGDLVGAEVCDHIICVNSLQYASDERVAVRNMLSVLRPGGRFAILLPAMKFLYGQMDVLAGHRQRYSRQDIGGIGTGQTIKDERIVYFNPIGALGWYANNLMRPTSLNDPSLAGQVAIFDKYIVPTSKFLDPLTRRFWGQSLLWCGRKQ